MIMKTKKWNNLTENLRFFLVLPAILLLFIIFPSSAAAQAAGEQTPYVAVEEMPQFPGGDVALLKYIAKNTQYPESAKDRNIQGKVIVKFCVTAAGGISQITILQSVNPDLDKEAMRVVKTLPTFIPGKKAGVAVPVWYLVPISFKLM
jgi:periplasmic protein TonB